MGYNKLNSFVKDIQDMDAINEVYKSLFPTGVPARRTVGVSAIVEDALIQIDVAVGNEEGTPLIV